VGGFHEHGTEPSDFIKCWKFDWLRRGHGSAIQTPSELWHHAVVTDVLEESATTCHLLPTDQTAQCLNHEGHSLLYFICVLSHSFLKPSTPALDPTQPRILWEPWLFPGGKAAEA
jgi:hypothetical protein